MTADAEELGRVIRSVQNESERLKSNILTWSQASQTIDVLQNAIGDLQNVMAEIRETEDMLWDTFQNDGS